MSFWLKVKKKKNRIPAELNDYCLLSILLITLVFHQSIKLIYSSINMFGFLNFRNNVKVLLINWMDCLSSLCSGDVEVGEV